SGRKRRSDLRGSRAVLLRLLLRHDDGQSEPRGDRDEPRHARKRRARGCVVGIRERLLRQKPRLRVDDDEHAVFASHQTGHPAIISDALIARAHLSAPSGAGLCEPKVDANCLDPKRETTRMEITRNNLDTSSGSPEWFTGIVLIDTVAVPEGSSTVASAYVH